MAARSQNSEGVTLSIPTNKVQHVAGMVVPAPEPGPCLSAGPEASSSALWVAGGTRGSRPASDGRTRTALSTGSALALGGPPHRVAQVCRAVAGWLAHLIAQLLTSFSIDWCVASVFTFLPELFKSGLLMVDWQGCTFWAFKNFTTSEIVNVI